MRHSWRLGFSGSEAASCHVTIKMILRQIRAYVHQGMRGIHRRYEP
jgi:hypothetical protein